MKRVEMENNGGYKKDHYSHSVGKDRKLLPHELRARHLPPNEPQTTVTKLQFSECLGPRSADEGLGNYV